MGGGVGQQHFSQPKGTERAAAGRKEAPFESKFVPTMKNKEKTLPSSDKLKQIDLEKSGNASREVRFDFAGKFIPKMTKIV